MSGLLEAALAYTARGWAVLPLHTMHDGSCTCAQPTCAKPAKHPRIRAWQDAATLDADQVHAWWQPWPDANIGIRTGRDLMVVDLDGRNGGEDSWAELVGGREVPATYEVVTGDGRHLYFTHPGREGAKSNGGLGAGIDVIVGPNYVVAPPSLHASGVRYRVREQHASIAPPPGWLVEALTAGRKAASRTSGAVVRAPEGTRNDTLNREAYVQLRRGRDLEAVADTLREQGLAAGLEPDEIEATLRSATRAAERDGPFTARPRLLTLDELDALPVPEPLVEDFLGGGELAVLFGPSGAGKTFVALDVGLHVASGERWHGRHVVGGPVYYLPAEGLAGIIGRTQAWRLAHPNADVGQFRVVDRTPMLNDAGAIETLASELGEAKLIVLDTLAALTPGMDENSSKDMGIAVRSAAILRDATGATVLLVHHTGHDGNRERGSSALPAAVDTRIRLSRGADLKLSCEKRRDHPPFTPFHLRLQPHGNSCVVVLPLEHRDGHEAVIEAARKAGAEDGGVTITEIRSHLKGKNATLNPKIRAAAEDPECPLSEVDSKYQLAKE